MIPYQYKKNQYKKISHDCPKLIVKTLRKCFAFSKVKKYHRNIDGDFVMFCY